MATITATTELKKLGSLAFRVGMPQDQLSRFLMAGYVPQPKGLQFHAYAREADKAGGPTAIAMAGTRGQAKSHAIFAQVVLDDMRRFDGLKVLYLRKIQKKATESFQDLLRKVLQFIPHEKKNNNLYLTNDSFMVLGGFRSEAEIDAYLGLEYDIVVIEDATTLTKVKRDAIYGAVRTSRDDFRPRKYLSFNPGGVGHAWAKREFYDPRKRGEETDTRFVHVQMGDNIFINPEYADYLNSLSGWLRRAWRDGDMEISAGQFFSNWNEAIHVKAPPDVLPTSWIYWASLDYGFVHWTMAYFFGMDEQRNIWVIDEHAARRWLTKQNARAVRMMLERHPIQHSHQPFKIDFLRSFVAGHDVFTERMGERGAYTIAAQYAAEGINLTKAIVDRVNGAARILELLGNPEAETPVKLFVSPNCRRLIEILPQMQTDPNRPEDVLKTDCDSDTGEGGDDPYDGFRYGVMAAPISGGWGESPVADYRG